MHPRAKVNLMVAIKAHGHKAKCLEQMVPRMISSHPLRQNRPHTTPARPAEALHRPTAARNSGIGPPITVPRARAQPSVFMAWPRRV